MVCRGEMADANRSRRAGIVAMFVVAVALVVLLWSSCGPEPPSAVDGPVQHEAPASSVPRQRKRTRETDATDSDASSTAAIGIPSIDGLGPRGSGFHTREEQIEVATLVPKAEALARFLLGRHRGNTS